ncbi:MAG: hypothetical protein HOO67_02385 [Candidatus Peribacteraceae bacterium]|nr:hypothetical protein [Candidatus Peribacteraceae bacterium]
MVVLETVSLDQRVNALLSGVSQSLTGKKSCALFAQIREGLRVAMLKMKIPIDQENDPVVRMVIVEGVKEAVHEQRRDPGVTAAHVLSHIRVSVDAAFGMEECTSGLAYLMKADQSQKRPRRQSAKK